MVQIFRISPQLGWNFGEISVDNFAGGGGASTGMEDALGKPVDIAINHDLGAVSMHTVNHPQTKHYCESVWDINPREVCAGRPVGLAWFSPDCKHFSKAKGGKPVEKKIRGLAWIVLRWAATVRPRVIMLENVEEFVTWGPLITKQVPVDEFDIAEGAEPGSFKEVCYPCPKNKGRTFKSFVNALRRHGYDVEWKELRACDYGAPTIRKRLFLVARCDDQPIVWPEATHGDPKSAAVKTKKLKPWRTAAECIDWNIPAPSIFERKKPLADATLRRIAKGIMRYVVENPEPFIVGCGGRMGQSPARGVAKPLQTVTAKADSCVVVPTLIQTGYGERPGQSPRVPGLDKPLGTAVAGGVKHGLVSALLAKHYGASVGYEPAEPAHTFTGKAKQSIVTAHMVRQFGQSVGSSPSEPVGTITPGGLGKTGLVTSHLVKLRGTCRDGQLVTDLMPTITGQGLHVGEVRAFLLKYYGSDQDPQMAEPLHTITTRDRFGLVTVRGEQYQIVDIGMRMLTPRELFRAQGFPENYIIDRDSHGKPITKTAQVARCGNSVCPPIAAALVRANMSDAVAKRKTA